LICSLLFLRPSSGNFKMLSGDGGAFDTSLRCSDGRRFHDVYNAISSRSHTLATWIQKNMTMFRETRSELTFFNVFSSNPPFDAKLIQILCERYRRIRWNQVSLDL
jgi:hypothetical protein